MIKIVHGNLISPEKIDTDMSVLIEGEKISKIEKDISIDEQDAEILDAHGGYICAGFIDLHLHGGGGYSFMNAGREEMKKACHSHLWHGTTTLLPTSVTDSIPETVKMVRTVKECVDDVSCTIPGVHLEGPFLSPAQCGAQSTETMLLPSEEYWMPLLEAWPDGIKMMGAAPELPDAMALGKELSRRGIVASIAHSDANYDTCIRAMENGYSDITHLYCGCSIVYRENAYRHGGVVEAGLLEDGFTVQVIADGKHLPPELLKLIYKCKGPEQMYLITDALFPAGLDMEEGSRFSKTAYSPDMILEDDVMKMADRHAFAGSIATMDRLVRNMVNLAEVPLQEAVTMATYTPAKRIGLEKRKGRVFPGYDADILILDEDLQVKAVIAKGKVIRKELS